MARPQDAIHFDVIEAHKENIQALPSGRSAKKLAQVLSPTVQCTDATGLPQARQPLGSIATPTNDAIRAEFEAEIAVLEESDDPLDIYDRYVRWILDAYPSAQATPAAQLHTVLERATQTFVSSSQYKNDPRYLKLWLQYIAFFAESPREMFIFLARHNIGERLALFYEEYAGWLESVGRWSQAEEVYKLGMAREARPQSRLIRKFGEFEARRAACPEASSESLALSTSRPALMSRTDPFATAEQQPRQGNGLGTQTVKSTKSKLQIFSDADSGAQASPLGSRSAGSRGWDTISSLADRKKENTMEAKPWTGQTLEAGGKTSGGTKMAVFRDPSKMRSQLARSHIRIAPSQHQVTKNPMTGRKERVFVDLQAVYPSPDVPGTEMSFEEIWAANRGWLDQTWDDAPIAKSTAMHDDVLQVPGSPQLDILHDVIMLDENGQVPDQYRDGRSSKKMKVMEVNETQIIKANLDSPSRPRMKRKRGSDATMTMHTKAATDDIYDIFNAPMKRPPEEAEVSAETDDDETDSNYTTSNGESTCTTTRAASMSEVGDVDGDADGDVAMGDNEPTDVRSLSEWSEFSTRKHIPDINGQQEEDDQTVMSDVLNLREADPSVQFAELTITGPGLDNQEGGMTITHLDEVLSSPRMQTTFVPIPPEDYIPNPRPYRDPAEVANNRLPFMTPITERTEFSLNIDSVKPYDRFGPAKTPSKRTSMREDTTNLTFDILSSPLREVVNEDAPMKKFPLLSIPNLVSVPKSPARPATADRPLIEDLQCNPVDDSVRNEILEKMQPPLTSYPGFYDHRHQRYERGNEIRKFFKSLKNSRQSTSADRTHHIVSSVTLHFPEVASRYVLKKELGAGAFAPVYLVESTEPAEEAEPDAMDVDSLVAAGTTHTQRRQRLEALKMELPPTPWEFHMMRLAHIRLGPQHRATASLSTALEMHLYQDEGFLVLPFHPHGTLLDVINMFRAEAAGGVMDETLAMFFTIELLRTVEALHEKQILHGDLKPDNCLLRLDDLLSSGSGSGSGSNHGGSFGGSLSSQWRADGSGGWAARGVTLIDFGRSIDMAAFAPGVQFIADWKTTAQDCAEVREGRPWTWQLDYHGLAGIVHCLLFGKYIETTTVTTSAAAAGRGEGLGDGWTFGLGLRAGMGRNNNRRYKIRETLKRYWQTEIWGELFEVLLNPVLQRSAEDGHDDKSNNHRVPPSHERIQSIRGKMESWLEGNCDRGVGLKALLGRVEGASRAKRV
ncbi:Mad3/BUB1 homology region 1-domain-containing protein [Coniella lustricola]|uniref:Mad3/BUB1 homology region 1-domain-containing protein n=1 Tax=Coniella lustricola TaxID=2025994 RepID=A0A2T3A0Z2_9PEZI|nr:Mad3/BUB1 homology region 1-domain-containing protein [Coniella lustricola]